MCSGVVFVWIPDTNVARRATHSLECLKAAAMLARNICPPRTIFKSERDRKVFSMGDSALGDRQGCLRRSVGTLRQKVWTALHHMGVLDISRRHSGEDDGQPDIIEDNISGYWSD